MRQAKLLVDEINRKRQAIRKTNSKHLIADYHKSIKSDIFELKEYCDYRGIDFKVLADSIV
jgi:hypothetical protein